MEAASFPVLERSQIRGGASVLQADIGAGVDTGRALGQPEISHVGIDEDRIL